MMAEKTPGGPVAVHSGRISGEVLDSSIGLQAFRGIPYAAPPVGDLRWRPPQDAAPWDGVRECVDFGPVCPQLPGLTDLVGDPLPPQDEDCLYLNIWTTNASGGEGLPVMVWIHGGGYTVGWSNQSAYEGSEFAKRGIVLVTINYRLGPMGFLAHPALSAESDRNVSGNYSMLDTVAALKWVNKNIAAFGGDANNVTVFGESAGGSIVSALCVSPMTKGLIHRAVSQSGGSDGQFAYLKRPAGKVRSAEEIGERWASKLVESDSDDVPATLRALPVEKLLERGIDTRVAIDDWFVSDFIESTFARGEQHDIPMIIGTNADEGTIFAANYPYQTVEQYRDGMADQFGLHAKEVLALYPVSSAEDIPGALNKFMGDTVFLRGSTQMLRGMDNVPSAAYQYVFTQNNSLHPERGAFHSAEMCYVFNTLHPETDKSDNPELAKAMIQYWVQFAKTGDPNVEGLPAWPQYKTDSAQYLELGDEIKTGSAYRHKWLQTLNDIR